MSTHTHTHNTHQAGLEVENIKGTVMEAVYVLLQH